MLPERHFAAPSLFAAGTVTKRRNNSVQLLETQSNVGDKAPRKLNKGMGVAKISKGWGLKPEKVHDQKLKFVIDVDLPK